MAKIHNVANCNSLTAINIGAYMPRSSNIKLPDMPGKIMAQIAIIPDKNTIKGDVSIVVGVIVVIKNALTVPIKKVVNVHISHLSIWRMRDHTAANISPKKNDHNNIGWFARRYNTTLDKVKMLMIMPLNSVSRNPPLICCQAAFKPS